MRLTDQLRSLNVSDPGRWPPSLRAAAVMAALVAVVVFGTPDVCGRRGICAVAVRGT